jgi:hypothetical protein
MMASNVFTNSSYQDFKLDRGQRVAPQQQQIDRKPEQNRGVSLESFDQFDGDQLRLLSQILRASVVGGLQSFARLCDESSDLFHHFLLRRAQLVDASLLQIFLGLVDAVIRPMFVRGLIGLGNLRRNLWWCRA